MVGPGGGPMVTVAKLAKVCLGSEVQKYWLSSNSRTE